MAVGRSGWAGLDAAQRWHLRLQDQTLGGLYDCLQ